MESIRRLIFIGVKATVLFNESFVSNYHKLNLTTSVVFIFCLFQACNFMHLFITLIDRFYIDFCFIKCCRFLTCTVLWYFYLFYVLLKELFPLNNDMFAKIGFCVSKPIDGSFLQPRFTLILFWRHF